MYVLEYSNLFPIMTVVDANVRYVKPATFYALCKDYFAYNTSTSFADDKTFLYFRRDIIIYSSDTPLQYS